MYICTANNNLGKTTEAEVELQVQYGPKVWLSASKLFREEGDELRTECFFDSYPQPKSDSITWTKLESPEFNMQIGPILSIQNVSLEHKGFFVCTVKNELNLTESSDLIQRSGQASFELKILSLPGKARISPEDPSVILGESITLTCDTTPEGFPAPNYR